jgi:hypothetical protein
VVFCLFECAGNPLSYATQNRVPTVRPEIIEDTNEIAIKIGGQKLAQLPRFVLGFGNDLRVRGLPL